MARWKERQGSFGKELGTRSRQSHISLLDSLNCFGLFAVIKSCTATSLVARAVLLVHLSFSLLFLFRRGRQAGRVPQLEGVGKERGPRQCPATPN